MKVVLTTVGSRGDVQPFLALAQALRAAGHNVILGAPPNFKGWIETYGIPYVSCGIDVQAFLTQHGTDTTSLAAVRRNMGMLRDSLEPNTAVLMDVAKGADLVVVGALQLMGSTVAEALRLPTRYVAYCPQLIASRQHPPIAWSSQTLPGWLNALGWRFNGAVWNYFLRDPLNAIRKRLGVAPIGDMWSYAASAGMLVASDPALGPLPPEALPTTEQVGSFFLPNESPLDSALETFLRQGPPPVYIGFGSMTDLAPAATSTLAVQAAREAGCRLVLARGWAGLDAGSDTNAITVGDVPHPQLFPRLAAVVHHGGAGTTAEVARAGVPQVIVPHLLDQHYWGHRIERLGVGPAQILRKHLTPRRLAEALARCVRDEAMRGRARDLATRMHTDGLARAVRALEAAAAQQRRETA